VLASVGLNPNLAIRFIIALSIDLSIPITPYGPQSAPTARDGAAVEELQARTLAVASQAFLHYALPLSKGQVRARRKENRPHGGGSGLLEKGVCTLHPLTRQLVPNSTWFDDAI